MQKYKVIHTIGSSDRSSHDIVLVDPSTSISKKKEDVLVTISGPMAFHAIGAFLYAEQIKKTDCIRIAAEAITGRSI